MTHTKEPWEIHPGPFDGYPGIESAEGRTVVIWGNSDEDAGVRGLTKATREANARRIVDCVNALANIPDPAAFVAAFEGMVGLLGTAREHLNDASPCVEGDDWRAEIGLLVDRIDAILDAARAARATEGGAA